MAPSCHLSGTHTHIRHVWSLGSTTSPISWFCRCSLFRKPFYQLCWNPKLAVFKCLSSVHPSGFRQSPFLPAPPSDHTGHHTPMAAGLWSSCAWPLEWLTGSQSLSPGRAPSKSMKIHFFTGQNQMQSKDTGLGLSKRSRRRSSKSTPIAWYQVLKSPHPQRCWPSSALPVLQDQKQWFC